MATRADFPGSANTTPQRRSPRVRRAVSLDHAGLLAPAILLAAWFLLAGSGLFPRDVLVPPLTVAGTLVELARDGELFRNLSASLIRLVCGYAIGALIGVALGAAMGLSRTVEDYLSPSFQLLRQLPTMALIPAFILLLGVGETVKIVIVAKAVALPIALATFEAARGIARVHLDVAGLYGVRGLALFRRVVFPATVPPIVTGMRLALGRSWMVLVGAELLIADSGLGQMLEWARQIFRVDIVLGGVIVTGLVGFLLDRQFRLIERRLERVRR